MLMTFSEGSMRNCIVQKKKENILTSQFLVNFETPRVDAKHRADLNKPLSVADIDQVIKSFKTL